MPHLEYIQLSDITYITDGFETVILVLNRKTRVMVMAHELYMKL